MILTTLAAVALLFQAPKADDPRPHRSFKFVYDAAVPEVPSGTKQVRLWIPVPLNTPDQTIGIVNYSITSGDTSSVLRGSALWMNQLGVSRQRA